MKIIGIDPGYERCGFAVLEKSGSQLNLLNFGIIKTSAQKDFSNRLLEISEDFEHLLDKYKPQVVSIEDIFFVQNVTTGIKVAEVRGALIYLAKKFGCQLAEPKPVEVKSAFTGNGKASKQEMQKMVQMTFQLDQTPKLDDAADAIAVGFWAGQNQSSIIN